MRAVPAAALVARFPPARPFRGATRARRRASSSSARDVSPLGAPASSLAATSRLARPRLAPRRRGPREDSFVAPRASAEDDQTAADAASSSPSADAASSSSSSPPAPSPPAIRPPAGAEVDLANVLARFRVVASPFWTDPKSAGPARALLGGVVALTLGTTAISVGFNFLGRDFYNAIAEKQPDDFDRLLKTYILAIAGAIPFFVARDYYQSVLTLRWRAWMTERYVEKYLSDRNFYHIQTGSVIDNPDQRIVDDISSFTATSLGLAFTLLNAGIDLVSFSGILIGIYEPLVVVLFVYAAGGTLISAKLGQPLVGLNFQQEAKEADFRYGLVRVRENAESVAFYAGEAAERSMLVRRLRSAVDNFGDLLIATRNVDFFTSCYRYLVTFLPAAVVAPLYFKGEIEFGVINQSSSAFSHILGDVSLVVYQIERLASFSAVTERLGQMTEVLETGASELVAAPGAGKIERRVIVEGEDVAAAVKRAFGEAADSLTGGRAGLDDAGGGAASSSSPRLTLRDLTVRVPGAVGASKSPLVSNLNLTVGANRSVLIMGPSGAGKTSLLRAVAGLWEQGDGEVRWRGGIEGALEGAESSGAESSSGAASSSSGAASNSSSGALEAAPNAATLASGAYFVPQRPYLVLGTLRQQLLYPTWVRPAEAVPGGDEEEEEEDGGDGDGGGAYRCGIVGCAPKPSDEELKAALRRVNLGYLIDREANESFAEGGGGGGGEEEGGGVADSGAASSSRRSTNVGLDAVGDWSSILSLGEQQRLAFARVLLARPRVAMLDEATSALDAANEAEMYEALRELPDCAFVSVGHRPSLVGFHDEVLRLEGSEGRWSVVDAEAYVRETTMSGAD